VTSHVSVLDEKEPLRNPLLASLTLHAGLAAVLTAGAFIRHSTQNWGDQEALGGSTMVNPVSKIPMVARSGDVNPVANDTETLAPKAPPEPKPVQKAKEPEPDAIPIKGRTPPKKPSNVTTDNEKFRPYTTPKTNQVFSTTGGATVSPLMGTSGSGATGLGKGSVLGDRFGAYAALLKQRISQNWKTQGIDPQIRTAPPVVVNFTLLRNGTIKDIKVKTSSGNAAIDLSAQRALLDVGKVDPLPDGFVGNEVIIEFWFELKR